MNLPASKPDRIDLVVAIDGPAASGKGTLARRLARHLGLPHLDTGLTYRAVAKALIDQNLDLHDQEQAAKIALNIDLGDLDHRSLADHATGEAASIIAVMPQVRAVLTKAQRAFANGKKGAVLDGRDIGTVVCPTADVKLFVTASAEARAKRRHDEMSARGKNTPFEQVLADLNLRDQRDSNRKDSPLKPAANAHLIDTTEMDIETAFNAALALVDKAVRAKKQDEAKVQS